ncbi:MAG: hypothetical protein K8I03_00180, partial [Ignavibacteria bacterium]|nr:hypothetical protein [Ignavibacteria bacterium]
MKNLKLVLILLSVAITNLCYPQCGWVCTYPYPTINDLYSIAYVNNNSAVAVGRLGTLLLTTNGGVNWINKLPCSKDTLVQAQFTDEYTGYAGGTESSILSKGIIYKTTDQGNNWSRIVAAENFDIKCIFFQNLNSGFAGGKGTYANLLKSTNAGINWTIIPNSMNIIIESIYFSNNSTGYIFGSFGDSAKIYKTTNSGSNWISLISMSYAKFYAMHFLNEITGFVSGRAGYNTSLLLKTTNSGENWNYIYNQNYMYSLFFTTINTGFACGYHFVSKTTNGGNNWISINNPNINKCVNFKDTNNGFTVGYDGAILKTTDEGQSWIQNSQIPNPGYIHKIQFTNRDTGFAFSENNILRTYDKGNSWQIIYQINYPPLKDLYAVNSDTVYV